MTKLEELKKAYYEAYDEDCKADLAWTEADNALTEAYEAYCKEANSADKKEISWRNIRLEEY